MGRAPVLPWSQPNRRLRSGPLAGSLSLLQGHDAGQLWTAQTKQAMNSATQSQTLRVDGGGLSFWYYCQSRLGLGGRLLSV